MNRRTSLLLSLLSACAAAVMVYGLYVWQLRELELQQQVTVVAPSRFLDAGEQLTEDAMTTVPMTASNVQDDMVTNAEEVLGLTALIPLGAGEPLRTWKLGEVRLLPTTEESVFQIPEDYVLSVSNDIRAGDKVSLYLSGTEHPRKLLTRDVVVASVKTAANREVTEELPVEQRLGGNGERLYGRRQQASGTIAHINVLLREQEWEAIDRACGEQGGKLVIALADAFDLYPGKEPMAK
ncbi:SAF domain-containing protein [Xylanibacillus composti]|uniref:SAF domain-containing protein n=1 Tax=Xylanibacillus composti TaxID=1572762 RepID=A0A8J4H770_9BACL|nr:SAF domain-containing protein [Xylanibacillus composti]GIQ71022.1 hypothetical protein XYCOK13_38460 [Xylanibacillus composti]